MFPKLETEFHWTTLEEFMKLDFEKVLKAISDDAQAVAMATYLVTCGQGRCVCVCVYVCVCVCVRVRVYVCERERENVYIHTFTYTTQRTYTRTHTHTHPRTRSPTVCMGMAGACCAAAAIKQTVDSGNMDFLLEYVSKLRFPGELLASPQLEQMRLCAHYELQAKGAKSIEGQKSPWFVDRHNK